jgi:hypothetical protein
VPLFAMVTVTEIDSDHSSSSVSDAVHAGPPAASVGAVDSLATAAAAVVRSSAGLDSRLGDGDGESLAVGVSVSPVGSGSVGVVDLGEAGVVVVAERTELPDRGGRGENGDGDEDLQEPAVEAPAHRRTVHPWAHGELLQRERE